MENYKIDLEEIEDLFGKIEKSFGIRFEDNELLGIKNFGELCDHITNKIHLENADDCTSQQAFYKLRDAISIELEISKEEITRQRKLEEILPKKDRKLNLKKIEDKLGFKLKILTVPDWVIFTLIAILILSFICFFFNWKFAISGILFSIFGFWVADLTANKIGLEDVGELVEKMTRENYLQSRRNQKTFNKKEVEKVLKDWFGDRLCVEKNELTREAEFV